MRWAEGQTITARDALPSRRTMLGMLAVATAGLLAPATVAGRSRDDVDRWARSMQRLTAALGPAATRAWRHEALRLVHRIPPAALRRATGLHGLAASLRADAGAEPQRRITLPPPPGLERYAFTTILARIDAGATVPAHGHHNMVSMHVVLRGAVHVRQYDRVRDEPAHLVIRPRLDRVCRSGDATAIAADIGNVHTFTGVTDAVALIVAAYDLDPCVPTARDYVDLDAAEPVSLGVLRVPRVSGPTGRS